MAKSQVPSAGVLLYAVAALALLAFWYWWTRVPYSAGIVAVPAAALGVLWSAEYCLNHATAPARGLGFLLVPAVLAGSWRLVMLCTAIAGVARFLKSGHPLLLYAAMAAAPFTGGLGFLIPLAYLLWAVRQGLWLKAVFAVASAVPGLLLAGWSLVQPDGIPLLGLLRALLRPLRWRGVPPLTDLLAFLAACGIAIAIGLTIHLLLRGTSLGTGSEGPLELAAVLLAIALAVSDSASRVSDPRTLAIAWSPLLASLALLGVASRAAWAVVPLLLTAPLLASPAITRLIRLAKTLQ